MTPKRKRTPEEIFDILEQQAAEDEARRILALSDEDLDRELYDLGFDPAAERAWGRALGERAVRQARQVRSASERQTAPRQPSPWVRALAASFAAALFAAGGYAALHLVQGEKEPLYAKPAPSDLGSPAPAPPAIEPADGGPDAVSKLD